MIPTSTLTRASLNAVHQCFLEQHALHVYDAIIRSHKGFQWFDEGLAFGYSPERIVAIALGKEPLLKES
jgi:hypothetical protein